MRRRCRCPSRWISAGSSESGGGSSMTSRDSTVAPIALSSWTSAQRDRARVDQPGAASVRQAAPSRLPGRADAGAGSRGTTSTRRSRRRCRCRAVATVEVVADAEARARRAPVLTTTSSVGPAASDPTSSSKMPGDSGSPQVEHRSTSTSATPLSVGPRPLLDLRTRSPRTSPPSVARIVVEAAERRLDGRPRWSRAVVGVERPGTTRPMPFWNVDPGVGRTEPAVQRLRAADVGRSG